MTLLTSNDRVHWQKIHEDLIAAMASLVGAKSKANSDINEALAKITDPEILKEYRALNAMNNEAVEKALKQE